MSSAIALLTEQGPRVADEGKLCNWQWIMARLYHEFMGVGSFSASVKEITRVVSLSLTAS